MNNLVDLPSLLSLTFGSYTFQIDRTVIIEELPSLEHLSIGQNSFRISDDQRSDGYFEIRNCPSLIDVVVGGNAFYDFNRFILTNLSSIQTFTTGDYSFYYLSTLVLSSMYYFYYLNQL